MVVRDTARPGVGGDSPQLERLADAGYEKGAKIPEGFDEHDDPYLSIPAYVDRIDEAWEEVKGGSPAAQTVTRPRRSSPWCSAG